MNQDECKVSRCSGNGPAVRFPFRLKGRQPVHCGYPGFDLWCAASNRTVMQLPFSVKLYVKKIDYKSQSIQVYDPDGCLPRQLPNLNLSASPFSFIVYDYQNYSLFNCSSSATKSYGEQPIPCLSRDGYTVYVIDYIYSFDVFFLSSCVKIYNFASLPSMIFTKRDFHLNWSQPICGSCEERGHRCGLIANASQSEVGCFNIHKPPKGRKKLIVTGICLGSLFLILAIFALYWVYKSDKVERANQIKIEKFLEDYKALKPARYTYADIKRITDQFKDKLGQGSYGTVFKGKLSSEIFVAVKVLQNSKGNGEEFINEVGTMGRIHHINVVRLVGYCADGYRRALVYEFLPNDSLEKFISSEKNKYLFLGWQKLQDIAVGIAKGVEYLHQGCDQRILHFDIKPHNILLDQNFTPKIADFGQAKLCSKDQSIVSITMARGTKGYIAPEVFSRNFGNVSYKSDVYSFGMLLLQIVGGTKNTDVQVENTDMTNFPEWIYNQLKREEEIIGIKETEVGDIARKLAIVGLWCIQWHPVDRPSMKVVVQMLEGRESLTVPANPFAAMKASAGLQRRPLNRELDIISEME